MTNATVAVIGAGPSGLSMLKQLRDDGFTVTAFERRSNVGGIWAYSPNPEHTTALPRTLANISKFVCGFSDYPMYDDLPPFLSQKDFQSFMEDYAKHYDLLKDIKFKTSLKNITRNGQDTKWNVEFQEESGRLYTQEFDKIALCHGYQTIAKTPKLKGQDLFEGKMMHSQQYRNPTDFKGKRVVVLGFSASVGDVVPDLTNYASKIYLSHRRGALPFKRVRNGSPADATLTWRRRQIAQFLSNHLPTLSRWISDAGINFLLSRIWDFPLDPEWRLLPAPSITLRPVGGFEFVIPHLKDKSVTSVYGIKRYLGPKSMELDDGTILNDIDAVIYCTGYKADFSAVSSFLQRSTPTAYGYADYYDGVKRDTQPMTRLWMNLFPPQYADSIALCCHSAMGKSNGFSFSDVTAMAISNVWRGVEPVPAAPQMEKWIDAHHEWVAGRWALDHSVDVSSVKQWEFQDWLHHSAGTGMENLGWGWAGWKFWWRDRKMYGLMNDGVETAHMYRYFETGKRKTWEGAREAILHANELVKTQLPVSKEYEKAMYDKYLH